MSKLARIFFFALIASGALGLARADGVQMTIPDGLHLKTLGTFYLKDPSGTKHTRREVLGQVVVAIFSVPNMSQGDRQERWSALLADKPKTKISDEVALLLFEDISQAGLFKKAAMDSMKKQFTPGSRPFLLIDQDGRASKKFGVPRGQTEILIFDKKGRLRDVEANLDDEDETIHRIKAITQKLLAE